MAAHTKERIESLALLSERSAAPEFEPVLKRLDSASVHDRAASFLQYDEETLAALVVARLVLLAVEYGKLLVRHIVGGALNSASLARP
ncbi:hypothetical protein [Muricoccus radiodurans]|uniref:hypothetical protein n=1 Tax=Muricoccus radiodurans TaxID=2231721 RepID=UPI003CEEE02C